MNKKSSQNVCNQTPVIVSPVHNHLFMTRETGGGKPPRFHKAGNKDRQIKVLNS